MKLLLCKNISSLGIVGDIVEVTAGYGRNYLIPHGIATAPTKANIRKVAEDRRVAEQEVIRQREVLEAYARRLEGVDITVRARANEEGVLYGSVGPREIATALAEEGYPVVSEHIILDAPIRHLDNVLVEVRLAPELSSSIKLWVVREKTDEDADEVSDESQPGREAGSNDDHPVE